MDIGLTLGSLAAIMILGWFAGRLFPVKNPLDAGRVERNLLRYEPDAHPDEVLISEDGLSALVTLHAPAGQIGVLRQLGDRVVCRLLGPGDIARVYSSQSSLTIVCADFTQPEITIVATDGNATKAKAMIETVLSAREALNAA